MEHPNNRYYVYLLLNPLDFYKPFYVGKGCGGRAQTHLQNGRSSCRKSEMIRAIRAQGHEPAIMYWQRDMSEDAAFALEIELIARFGRLDFGTGILTNRCKGGNGIKQTFFTPEMREQMRAKMTGERNPLYGIGHTPEARKKMSASHRARAEKGLVTRHSGEWRARLREHNAGGLATAKQLLQIDLDGIVVATWNSSNQACLALGIGKGNMSQVAKPGSHRTLKDCFWRWASDPDVQDGRLEVTELNRLRLKPHQRKTVHQVDPKTQQVVRVWESFQDIANELDLKYATLWNCAKKGRLHAGFLWVPQAA